MSTVPIIAEVLDKEPSIFQIWLVFGCLALTGFMLSRYWRWWLATIFPIVVLIPALFLFEEFSSVGLLSTSESSSYVVQFYIAIAAALVIPIVGAVINFRKTRAIQR